MGKFFARMTKRDFIYIIMFLLYNVALLILKDNLTASEVVNVISIGAGLSSIFLAIVAIEFSFKQAEETSRQNNIVQGALYTINEKVEHIHAIKSEISSFREQSATNMSQLFQYIKTLKDRDTTYTSTDNYVREQLPSYENGDPIPRRSLESEILNYIYNKFEIMDLIPIRVLINHLSDNGIQYEIEGLLIVLRSLMDQGLLLIRQIDENFYLQQTDLPHQ